MLPIPKGMGDTWMMQSTEFFPGAAESGLKFVCLTRSCGRKWFFAFLHTAFKHAKKIDMYKRWFYIMSWYRFCNLFHFLQCFAWSLGWMRARQFKSYIINHTFKNFSDYAHVSVLSYPRTRYVHLFKRFVVNNVRDTWIRCKSGTPNTCVVCFAHVELYSVDIRAYTRSASNPNVIILSTNHQRVFTRVLVRKRKDKHVTGERKLRVKQHRRPSQFQLFNNQNNVSKCLTRTKRSHWSLSHCWSASTVNASHSSCH